MVQVHSPATEGIWFVCVCTYRYVSPTVIC